MLSPILAFTAAVLSGAMAFAALWRRWRSVAAWAFIAGMILLCAECVADGLSVQSHDPQAVARLQTVATFLRALLPGVWLIFSLSFSRGNSGEFLEKWRVVLAAAFIIPVGLAASDTASLIEVLPHRDPGPLWWLKLGTAARAVHATLLVGAVLVLMNLEATMRSAVGTMRWRIKFVVLGLGVIFGARVYTCSQTLLFSGTTLAFADIDTSAILIGSILLGIAHFRTGHSEIDVYPSREVLSGSLTALLVGTYLFIVGVLAELVKWLGGIDSFQTQVVVVMIGITGLAVLLFSDRLRQRIRSFVSRHFARPAHDSRRIWTRATQQMAKVMEPAGLCAATARLISETFQVLSVGVWLVDEDTRQLALAASTAADEAHRTSCAATDTLRAGLAAEPGPFDLEKAGGAWAGPLRTLSTTQFPTGGNRICIPLFAGGHWIGAAILADRVDGVSYSVEELDLLKCIGDQLAVGLLNLRLTGELMQAKELEAFQTMSTFFVHDLKNAVSGLNLMLKNLPVHFDDPEFRADALRGIGNTVSRIDMMIERLSALRKKVELRFEEADLNALVEETIARQQDLRGVRIEKHLGPVPKIDADREHLRSVIANLLLNARDALGADGVIEVTTADEDGRAVLSIRDNGCGMSAGFMRDSLFRPFQSTKKKGLGIGMFQSRTIVERHGGRIQVESEAGKGTTFRVSFPLRTTA